MIQSTDAYELLRVQSQEILDFVVVVCYAVPYLRKELKSTKKSGAKHFTLEPDYFKAKRQHVFQLLDLSEGYRFKLSKYVIISNFSFFETYVRSALEEVVNFHGGKEQFPDKVRDRTKKHLNSPSHEVVQNQKKLQEHPKLGKESKYRKHTNKLLESDYVFPSDLFASYGIAHLIAEIGDRNFKSFKIPDLLREAFLMDVPKDTVDEFNRIRDIRNRIGHGKTVNLGLAEAMEINKFLRDFARDIDEHLTKHFFIIEEYR